MRTRVSAAGFAARVAQRRTWGFGLYGALLAVAVGGTLLLGFASWFQARVDERREVGAARKLVVLAGAVEGHVRANYGTLLGGSDLQLNVGALKAANLLPLGFDESGDAMKRELRVWVLPQGGGRLRVASMQAVQVGDTRRPTSGVFEARGTQALGIVDRSGRLWGPTTQEDVTEFQAAAGGHPRRHALVVYQEFDRENVCGDYVFRRTRLGCPDAARMETDLSMSGNDVIGANVVQAQQLEVQDELSAGELRIDNDLSVGTSVTVDGAFAAPDGLTFTGDARFTGTVDADEVTVTRRLDADSAKIANDVDAGGTVTAADATVTGNVTASTGTVMARNAVIADEVDVSGGFVLAGTLDLSGDLNAAGSVVNAASGTIQGALAAGSVQAGSITAAGNINGAGVDARGAVSGGTASFNFLAVGSCSGC